MRFAVTCLLVIAALSCLAMQSVSAPKVYPIAVEVRLVSKAGLGKEGKRLFARFRERGDVFRRLLLKRGR